MLRAFAVEKIDGGHSLPVCCICSWKVHPPKTSSCFFVIRSSNGIYLSCQSLQETTESTLLNGQRKGKKKKGTIQVWTSELSYIRSENSFILAHFMLCTGSSTKSPWAHSHVWVIFPSYHTATLFVQPLRFNSAKLLLLSLIRFWMIYVYFPCSPRYPRLSKIFLHLPQWQRVMMMIITTVDHNRWRFNLNSDIKCFTCYSWNTRLRTLPVFPRPRAFEKGRRQAFCMVKSEVAYLNVLLNLNVHSDISKVLVPTSISTVLVPRSISKVLVPRSISKVLVPSSSIKVIIE